MRSGENLPKLVGDHFDPESRDEAGHHGTGEEIG